MVDEVQTGVAITGKMWAFEHWGLDEAPDAVIFAKKMISAGFFYKSNLIPHEVCLIKFPSFILYDYILQEF